MKRNVLYGLGTIVGLAVLAFAYYAVSPLFITIEANDAAPVAGETLSVSAQVVGSPGHPASGTARIVRAEGKTYVRYENFKTINGPDIYVYLSKDLDAADFIDLGAVRATEGNINYEIPAGVDVSEYTYVLTWCKQFDVLFNYANISGA